MSATNDPRPHLSGEGRLRGNFGPLIGLAVVFARAKQSEAARKQVEKCFAGADEPRLRSLSTGALYRLLVLGRAYQINFTDPKLHELALSLVPSDMRARL